MTEIKEIITLLEAGDRRAIARVITLLESTKPEDVSLAEKIVSHLPTSNRNSKKIGITGPPGVGKSTLLTCLVEEMSSDLKIAILAIDPTSSASGGSIMGDKTRMGEVLHRDNLFVRPSPSGNRLGGVAARTYETTLFLERIGFDYIFIETVGVGQSEYYVRHIADHLLLLLPTSGGDDLQAIKKGINEAADAYIITKSEEPTLAEAQKMKEYIVSSDKNHHPVFLYSAQDKTGLSAILDFITQLDSSTDHENSDHAQFWIEHNLSYMLESWWRSNHSNEEELQSIKRKLENQEIDYIQAKALLENHIQSSDS